MLTSLSLIPPTAQLMLAAIIGLILGSFATAVTYRELQAISWAFGENTKGKPSAKRSACAHCKTTLRILDLIPLMSWLIQKGKCRHCQTPIGAIYPLTELFAAGACMIVVLMHGLSLYAIFMMLLVPFLIALLIIDIKKMLLPNRLVLIVTAIGLLSLLSRAYRGDIAMQDLIIHGVSAIGYGIFAFMLGWITSIALKKEALGMGDVKFFAAAGLWLGPLYLADFCLLSGIMGIVFGIAWRVIMKNPLFPFGPALILSFFTLLLIDGSFLLQFTLK